MVCFKIRLQRGENKKNGKRINFLTIFRLRCASAVAAVNPMCFEDKLKCVNTHLSISISDFELTAGFPKAPYRRHNLTRPDFLVLPSVDDKILFTGFV
jgi:hypothetical protein